MPAGLSSGECFTARLADGREFLVAPPDGLAAGEVMHVAVPKKGTSSSDDATQGVPIASLYSTEFINQAKPGHTKGKDCMPRHLRTADMKTHNVKRPTAVHW